MSNPLAQHRVQFVGMVGVQTSESGDHCRPVPSQAGVEHLLSHRRSTVSIHRDERILTAPDARMAATTGVPTRATGSQEETTAATGRAISTEWSISVSVWSLTELNVLGHDTTQPRFQVRFAGPGWRQGRRRRDDGR
jgi:hypothetical protein